MRLQDILKACGITSTEQSDWSLVPGPEHPLVVRVYLGRELHHNPGGHVDRPQGVVGEADVDAGVVPGGPAQTEDGVESELPGGLVRDGHIVQVSRQGQHLIFSNS